MAAPAHLALLQRCRAQWALADVALSERARAMRVLKDAPLSGCDREELTRRAALHDDISVQERRRALMLSSRLAKLLYGVGLGQRARIRETDGSLTWDLLVDFLRPTVSAGRVLVACSGEDRSTVRPFLLLGTAELEVLPSNEASQVVSIEPLLRRTGKRAANS